VGLGLEGDMLVCGAAVVQGSFKGGRKSKASVLGRLEERWRGLGGLGVGKVNGIALGKIDVSFGSGGVLILCPGNVLVEKGVFVGYLGTLELACKEVALGLVLEGAGDRQR
jgi:hypothetical protein